MAAINGTTPPLDYGGFPPHRNGQGTSRCQLSLAGGGGGPPDDPPDDEDEDGDDEGDEEDEEEEEEEDDDRTRRRRRRSRDDREIKNDRPRILIKEAERVSIPAWPRIHQLDNWKMQLLMNVLSACADPDTDTWTKWLEQALGLNPDLNMLSDSGGDRFATIDIKMAMGMQNMLKQAPDEAKDVYLDATRHSELRHQQGVIVKGQELVALVTQSFRTSDRTDLVYHIEHLFNLDFPGDKNLVRFRNKWYDLLLEMRSEDKPSKLALRDIPYRKIKGGKKMEFGLNAYHRLPDKHPQKTYEFLLALIDYQIKADREDLMLDMKERSVKSMMKSGGKDAASATGKQENQGGKGKKGTPGGPDAAPSKGPRWQDGASDRGRSPGGGKDNPCWYHFKSAKGRVKGNECTFSHSKKTEHKLENMPKGKGKGKSKSRSSSPPRKWYGSRKCSTSTRMERSPTSKTREGNGNEKENGTVMRTMRMSLISTCTSTRRSSRAVIIENYQPIKSNDH